MADAQVTQIGRYVLVNQGEATVQVTQIARRVLYPFTCEPGTIPPIIVIPIVTCPDTLLEDPPGKAIPHFLRTGGVGRPGNDPPSAAFPTVAPPRDKF